MQLALQPGLAGPRGHGTGCLLELSSPRTPTWTLDAGPQSRPPQTQALCEGHGEGCPGPSPGPLSPFPSGVRGQGPSQPHGKEPGYPPRTRADLGPRADGCGRQGLLRAPQVEQGLTYRREVPTLTVLSCPQNQVVLQTAAAPDTGGPGAEAGPCSLAPSSGGHLGCLAGAQTFSHTPSSPAARPALCSPTPRVAPDLGVPQGCAWWWVPGRPY